METFKEKENTPRLYGDLADLWPVLSPPEDYEAEAAAVRSIIEETLGLGRTGDGEGEEGRRWSLLELGAGGGHTLWHLADGFDCVAADLSPTMLAQCEVLNPKVTCVVGDMRTLRLGRLFDAVLLHDAVDYMTTEHDARDAIATAGAHLKPGGVCIVAPTYLEETFEDHDIACDHRADDGLEVVYTSYIRRNEREAQRFTLTMTLFIRDGRDSAGASDGRDGRGVMRVVVDEHRCGLFSGERWRSWMTEAGMKVEVGSLTCSGDGDEEVAEGAGIAAFVGRMG